MKIEYLADNEQYVNLVNDWQFEQWGRHYSDSKKENWLKDLRTRLNKEEVPTVFIAFKEGKAVGTASLIKHDMDTHQHYSPWLADVYVDPDYRGNGIGTRLVERVVEEGRKIGLDKLYLFTRDAKGLYLKLGWKVIETTNYHGKSVNIMAINLD